MPVIYKKWDIRPGKAMRLQHDARKWLPRGATLISLTPDFAGTPLSGGPITYSNNQAQQLVTCAADASVGSKYLIPVDVVASDGNTDRQEFEIEVI